MCYRFVCLFFVVVVVGGGGGGGGGVFFFFFFFFLTDLIQMSNIRPSFSVTLQHLVLIENF